MPDTITAIPTIGLVIPCYNEEARLPVAAFIDFISQHASYLLIFVNDGSRDRTWQVLQTLAARHPQIVAYDCPRNGGKAEAVRLGMLYAHQQYPHLTYIGFADADLATPLTEFNYFADTLAADAQLYIVTGCRLKRLGAGVERTTARHLFGRSFATFANWLIPLNMYDTQCGAKLMRADIVPVLMEMPFLSRWIFDIELLIRLHQHVGYAQGQRGIFEYPLHKWHDVGGSKLSPYSFFSFFRQLLAIHWHYKLKKTT